MAQKSITPTPQRSAYEIAAQAYDGIGDICANLQALNDKIAFPDRDEINRQIREASNILSGISLRLITNAFLYDRNDIA